MNDTVLNERMYKHYEQSFINIYTYINANCIIIGIIGHHVAWHSPSAEIEQNVQKRL